MIDHVTVRLTPQLARKRAARLRVGRRISSGALGCVLAGIAVIGCAPRPPAGPAFPPPTTDELPNFEFGQSKYPAAVKVEGRQLHSNQRLLPDFAAPAQTDEEKKILGEDKKPAYDPLALYPRRRVDYILPDKAGPNTAVYGSSTQVGLISAGTTWSFYHERGSAVGEGPRREIWRVAPRNRDAVVGVTGKRSLRAPAIPDPRRANHLPSNERD